MMYIEILIIAIIDFVLFPFGEYITETITVSKNHLEYEIMKKQKYKLWDKKVIILKPLI